MIISPVITAEQIMKSEKLQKEVTEQLVTWYTRDIDYVNEKRSFFRDVEKKLTDPRNYDSDTIRLFVLFRDIKSFMGAYNDASLSVTFEDNYNLDEDLAYMFEKAAEMDRITMRKDRKDSVNLRHALQFGTGIRVRVGMDKVKKIPIYEQIHPDTWVPDRHGNVIDDNFEFHIFERQSSQYTMDVQNQSAVNKYFNIDKLNEWCFMYNSDVYFDKKEWRLLQWDEYYEAIKTLACYITFRGRKYYAEFGNMGTLLIKWVPIPALTEEERKNPMLVKFPVSITNLFPLEYDPFGLSYSEIIISKQDAMNKLANLALLKEQRSAGFQNYLYDPKKIPNADLLATRSDKWPNFIPAKSRDGSPLSNFIAPVQEEKMDGNTINLVDKIDQYDQLDTNMTNQSRGIDSAGSTLGQSRQLQTNANLLFLLDYTHLSYGEIDFWKNIWYRSMLEYLPQGEEKLYRQTRGFGSPTIKLKRSDFEYVYDPEIRVVSSRLQRLKNQQEIAYLVAKQQTLAADPKTPEVSKKILARHIDKLNGLSRDLIYVINPMSADEIRAKNYCKLINAGERPRNFFKPGMDLQTYYIYVAYCDDNEIKQDIMLELENRILEEGSQVPTQEQMPSMPQRNVTASNASQMTSNFIQSMADDNKEPTLADIRA